MAVRALPGFALATSRTEPLPEPVSPLAIVSHGALLLAVQVHPGCDVTAIAAWSPAELMPSRAGETSMLQVGPGVGVGVGAGEGVGEGPGLAAGD